MNASSAALAVAASSRGELDYERAYRANRDPVYAYVKGMLRDRASAEDVTSQTFERAWARRRSFDPARGSERAWLFAIARNLTLDELRRQRRFAGLPEDEPSDEGAGDVAERAAERVFVQQALAGLKARDRELLAMKFFAGLTNREIAALIDESESNVGTRLCRLLDQLRKG